MDKKILTVLGISLALNFIFIGFEASRICCRPIAHVPPVRPAFIPDRPAGQFVPPERKVMREAFQNVFKNHEKDLKEAQKAVEEALNKEPFDAGQFKDALQKASAVRKSVDEAVQENMVEMISKMTPEERHRFAEGFSNAKKHFRPNADKMKKECRGKEKHRKDHRFEKTGKDGFPPHKLKRFHKDEDKEFRKKTSDRKRMKDRKYRKHHKKQMMSEEIEKTEAPVPEENEQPEKE